MSISNNNVSFGGTDDYFDEWHTWQESFDAPAVLRQYLNATGFDLDDVKKIRANLARRGENLDPNREFYLLLRHIPYERRQKLKHKARLAWDYYELAEMMGWFLSDATGEVQPQTDDLTRGGTWKRRFYGIASEDIDYDSANVLRRILQDLTLDITPHLLLIVEGESEAAFINEWSEQNSIDFDLLGVQIMILDGIPDLNAKRTRNAVIEARKMGMGVIVVVDHELAAEKRLQKWVSEGLLPRIFDVSALDGPNPPWGGLIWKPCFEDANFSLDELLAAWKALIATQKPEFIFDTVHVRKRVEETKACPPLDKNGKAQLCDSWIRAMELANRGLRLPWDKPALARNLATLYGERDMPITSLLFQCQNFAVKALHYGPPHPSGGFGHVYGDDHVTSDSEADDSEADGYGISLG